jgi:hypothetical protein
VKAQLQQLLVEQVNALELHNPGGQHSGCASTTVVENDDNLSWSIYNIAITIIPQGIVIVDSF